MPSSTQQQEWLSGNQETQFPFRDACLGAAETVPTDFLLDLRLFLTGTTETEVFLQSVTYNATFDTYALTFCAIADSAVLINGGVKRLEDSGGSRVGKKQFIGEGTRVALFTPGPRWEDPTWGGAGTWTKTWSADESAVETSLVNPGPQTFRRIFIDGETIPPENEWPYGGQQSLVAGYNIEFGFGRGRVPVLNLGGLADMVDLTCGPGLGEGFPPLGDPGSIDYVATFNGRGPDSKGNINIDPQDCLRVFQPKTEEGVIPHRLQLASDCAPCCPCQEYRHVSRAVGRRSAKFKDLCDELAATIKNSETVYNDAVQMINHRRKPLAVIRNVRALASHIIFSVQNMTDIPLFAYVAFTVTQSPKPLGAIATTQSNIASVTQPGGTIIYDVIEADKVNLPPLPFHESENAGNGFPTAAFSNEVADILLRVGSKTMAQPFAPIPPGGAVEVNLYFPAIQEELEELSDADAIKLASIAGSLPSLKFRTATVYGASQAYGCAGETYACKVIPSDEDPDFFYKRCDTPFETDFRTVPIA